MPIRQEKGALHSRVYGLGRLLGTGVDPLVLLGPLTLMVATAQALVLPFQSQIHDQPTDRKKHEQTDKEAGLVA